MVSKTAAMIIYMNPDTFQVFNKEQWHKLYLQMHNTEGFTWTDGIERPYSGEPVNNDVWKYTYRYKLNNTSFTFHILKITK